MPRETKAQKAARVALLLADYDAKSRELHKLDKTVERMKDEIRELAPGAYGEWSYAEGSTREILDQKEAKARLEANGLEVPTVETRPSIVVRHTQATK